MASASAGDSNGNSPNSNSNDDATNNNYCSGSNSNASDDSQLLSKIQIFEPLEIPKKSAANKARDERLAKIHNEMKDENERLKSFFKPETKWPLSFLDPKELAKSGFYYLWKGDRVQCPFCTGIVEEWEPGDSPLHEHLRHYPLCPFIQEYDVGNIPIDKDPIKDEGRLRGQDVCGNIHPSHPQITENHGVNANEVVTTSQRGLTNEGRRKRLHSPTSESNFLNDLGVISHTGPKFPQYASLDARIKSYTQSPFQDSDRVKRFAEAGFFYGGELDNVKCYYCNGELSKWEPADEPWVEHAGWYPQCQFLELNMGSNFIRNSQESVNKRNKRYKLPDDALAEKAVVKWLKSSIVLQVTNCATYDPQLVKDTLAQRWINEQQEFKDVDEFKRSLETTIAIADAKQKNENEALKLSIASSSSLSSSARSTSSSSPNSSSSSEQLLCKICLDKDVEVLFLPCGHVVACARCAPGVTNCPICRKTIKGSVRTFFS